MISIYAFGEKQAFIESLATHDVDYAKIKLNELFDALEISVGNGERKHAEIRIVIE